MPTIAAADLDIRYREVGPADAPPVLLIHGWPDNASTWDRVADALSDRFRLLVRCPRASDLQGFLRATLATAPPERGGVRVDVDVDPMSFL